MEDPAIVLLEWTLRRYCDAILSDETFAGEYGPVRRVRWRFRHAELQVELRYDPQTNLARRDYLWWRARGQQFNLLPSRPTFVWQSGDGWRLIESVGEWRQLLANIASAPDPGPGRSPEGGSGRPVRPRSGPPALDASAAATPEVPAWEEERWPALPLRDRARRDGERVR